MKSRGWTIAGVFGIGIIAILVTLLLREPAISFSSITQAHRDVQGLNYNCCSDRADGIVDYGFMVSKDEATWEDASLLCKLGPMREGWKNKVWVAPMRSDGTMPTIPDDAGTRIWGQVFVFGDRAFISELESGLRKKRVFTL
jgi:hypothetical protein